MIAPSWCSSSLLRLLAGKMKATPIISENTPNEPSRACWVQPEPPTPRIIAKSLCAVCARWYKRYCQVFFFSFSLSSPVFLTEMGLSPSDVVPKQLRSHLNALVSIPANLVSADRIQRSPLGVGKKENKKKKVNVWASKQTSVTSLSCFQPSTVR